MKLIEFKTLDGGVISIMPTAVSVIAKGKTGFHTNIWMLGAMDDEFLSVDHPYEQVVTSIDAAIEMWKA